MYEPSGKEVSSNESLFSVSSTAACVQGCYTHVAV